MREGWLLTGLAFSPTPTTAVVGQTVSFSASATTPNAGASISSFVFAFGDGSVITVAASPSGATTASGAASHAYSAANTYFASATATDSTGAQGSTSGNITVGGGQKIALSAVRSSTDADRRSSIEAKPAMLAAAVYQGRILNF